MSGDVFPLLDTSELALCLQSCDFSLASEESISRPTSQWVITLYKQIIDSFMGISADTSMNSDTLYHSKDDNVTSKNGKVEEIDDVDDVYSETLQVLVLNKICYRFFQNIGVSDFNMMDLYKPDTQRTGRLLSAVVNYARFREERMFDCNRFISQTETLLGQLRTKFDDYNLLQQQMKQYDEDEKLIGSVLQVDGKDELDALESNNRDIETQLKKLTHIQETLSIDYNNYKEEKQKMLKELESQGFQIVELELQRQKLQKYSEANIDELSRSIEELQRLLSTNKAKLSELEKLQSSLNISKATFQRLIEELYDVLRIVSIELQGSHKKEIELEDLKQQLKSRRNKMSDILSSSILQKVSMLQEQLNIQKEKLGHLMDSARGSSEVNAKKLADLQKQYTGEVVAEVRQAEQHIEEDLINGEIKDVEQKMRELRVQFQQEVDSVELEYSLLAGHINRYMETMLQSVR